MGTSPCRMGVAAKRGLSLLWVLFLFVQGCATSQAPSPRGRTYYTTANIWYTDANAIPSTNYPMGGRIPFGTKAKIEKVTRGRIVFRLDDGLPFTIVRRHGRISMREHFERYFSASDPKAPGGMFDDFTYAEKRNIELGNVELGMSREALLASYGYPPSHATPDLRRGYWRYWVTNRQQVGIGLIDGKVASIMKGKRSVSSLMEDH